MGDGGGYGTAVATNRLASLQFDGSADWMSMSYTNVSFGDFSLYMNYCSELSGSNQHTLSAGNTDSFGFNAIITDESCNFWDGTNSTNSGTVDNIQYDDHVVSVLGDFDGAGEAELRLDGDVKITGATYNNGGLQDTFGLGSTPTGNVNFFNGQFAEIILYETLHDDTDRDVIESFMTNVTTGTVAGTLDAQTRDCTLAFSTRKLYKEYFGPLLRVREDDGNTETDIYPDSNGILDEAAIITHCGANNGYVTRWYDQSGELLDIEQATTTSQPQIYDGSEVLKDAGGLPAPLFGTTRRHLDRALATATIGALQDHTMYARITSEGPAHNWQPIMGWDTGATVLFDPFFFENLVTKAWDGTTSNDSGTDDLVLNAKHICTSLGDDSANTIDLRLDGVAKIIGGLHSNQTVGTIFSIGSSAGGSQGEFRGHISEFLFWHQTLHNSSTYEAHEAALIADQTDGSPNNITSRCWSSNFPTIPGTKSGCGIK